MASFLWVAACLFCVVQIVQATNVANETTLTQGSPGDDDGSGFEQAKRPVIYTYFERIVESNRTTGMTDDEDDELLRIWKDRWESAGYNPVVLAADDLGLDRNAVVSNTKDEEQSSSRHSICPKSRFSGVLSKLDALHLDDFCNVLFRRWIAMAAVGGGWYSDYDNFPLRSFSTSDEALPDNLPNDGKLTIYNIGAPTLASGTRDQWLDTLEALLDDAKDHCVKAHQNQLACFYTDSLAIHSLLMEGNEFAPKTARHVAIPFDKNDPVSLEDPQLCGSKQFRSKRTVHFGPGVLQRGRHTPPEDRLPKHRSKLAKNWLNKWNSLCNAREVNQESEYSG